MTDIDDIGKWVEGKSYLYRLQGMMLARCPVTNLIQGCGVYHDKDGMVVYISDEGIESLSVTVEDRDKTLPEFLDSHGIEHHFKRASDL